MGRPHVVTQLEKQYIKIAGERDAVQQRIVAAGATATGLEPLHLQVDARRAMLTHIEACIALFEPKWNPAQISPKAPRRKRSPFAHGELLNLAYTILRQANAPATTRQILQAAFVAGLMKQKQAFDPDVRSALTILLRNQEQHGTVISTKSRPIRWSVRRSPSRPA